MKGIGNIERKERQPVTRGIKNCRDSRLFKGCSPLQLFVYLDRESPAIPYLPMPLNVRRNGSFN